MERVYRFTEKLCIKFFSTAISDAAGSQCIHLAFLNLINYESFYLKKNKKTVLPHNRQEKYKYAHRAKVPSSQDVEQDKTGKPVICIAYENLGTLIWWL